MSLASLTTVVPDKELILSKLIGQKFVVTGASSGIGLAITRVLLEAGVTVIGIARDFSKSSLSHSLFTPIELDLADIDQLESKLKSLLLTPHQAITGLVNNVGTARMAYLEQLSIRDMRTMIDTNFLSQAIITKLLLPQLKQQSGTVIFIGSEAALKGGQQGSVYCASKFALRGFAQSLREECSKSELRITLINPGAVRTAFYDRLGFEPGDSEHNAIASEDVAEAVMMVIDARPGTVFDEINLSPLKRVWQRKH